MPTSARIRSAFTDAFTTIVRDGMPAALEVRQAGRVVVDLAAGTDASGRPFTSRRPVFLYSAVKPFAALTVLIAVRDGALDLDARVADVWPAFGAHGKDTVTVRQALAHGAAVPGWREPVDLAALADRVAAAEALADSQPWWPPGEPGEHAVSYGHLLDGILRHATGDDVVAWWQRMQAATGVRVDLLPGVREPALLDDPGGAWRAGWSAAPGLMGDLLRNPADLLDVEVVNADAGRALVAPAVTGYASASDLAAAWSWWSSPEAVRVLGEALHAAATTPQLTGRDHVLDRDVAWACGPQVDETSYGMGGVGGCVAWVERDLDLVIAFTTPQVGAFERLDPLDDAVAALV